MENNKEETLKKGKELPEAVLDDILCRLRKQEELSGEKDCELDRRLDTIEKDIEGVKKALGILSWVVKIVGGIITAGIAIWNIVIRFLPKGHGKV